MGDKLTESEKTISYLKAKNENFLRQVNEQNTMEQSDELEKGFWKNMNEFSFILQEEYRNSLQKQSEEKEKTLKQSLSETKKKLFEAQVKSIKKRKIKHNNK